MKTNIWSGDCLVKNFLQAYVEASMLKIMNLIMHLGRKMAALYTCVRI